MPGKPSTLGHLIMDPIPSEVSDSESSRHGSKLNLRRNLASVADADFWLAPLVPTQAYQEIMSFSSAKSLAGDSFLETGRENFSPDLGSFSGVTNNMTNNNKNDDNGSCNTNDASVPIIMDEEERVLAQRKAAIFTYNFEAETARTIRALTTLINFPSSPSSCDLLTEQERLIQSIGDDNHSNASRNRNDIRKGNTADSERNLKPTALRSSTASNPLPSSPSHPNVAAPPGIFWSIFSGSRSLAKARLATSSRRRNPDVIEIRNGSIFSPRTHLSETRPLMVATANNNNNNSRNHNQNNQNNLNHNSNNDNTNNTSTTVKNPSKATPGIPLPPPVPSSSSSQSPLISSLGGADRIVLVPLPLASRRQGGVVRQLLGLNPSYYLLEAVRDYSSRTQGAWDECMSDGRTVVRRTPSVQLHPNFDAATLSVGSTQGLRYSGVVELSAPPPLPAAASRVLAQLMDRVLVDGGSRIESSSPSLSLSPSPSPSPASPTSPFPLMTTIAPVVRDMTPLVAALVIPFLVRHSVPAPAHLAATLAVAWAIEGGLSPLSIALATLLATRRQLPLVWAWIWIRRILATTPLPGFDASTAAEQKARDLSDGIEERMVGDVSEVVVSSKQSGNDGISNKELNNKELNRRRALIIASTAMAAAQRRKSKGKGDPNRQAMSGAWLSVRRFIPTQQGVVTFVTQVAAVAVVAAMGKVVVPAVMELTPSARLVLLFAGVEFLYRRMILFEILRSILDSMQAFRGQSLKQQAI
eukprot:CAMPEP_0175055922 /NCGR_PEP_ID=MMETSP0052_2-20121109/10364_1 /TAXON_ID=51329 ORGANISM="Polytomella parva, Strain SAG 63-3" /NCGR_SAMPLE_ID=MMETSP0052_2 /ASSEMBLY_ACC=CAM_ASM_000194 /LENGTH=754 /DNA_ID=CAMNT_0016320851 /DNA_START=375 /DNA_END=2639 /DNA_ORIENTATION=+